MHDRTALGAADVDDDVLARMVATLLGVEAVELVSSSARHVSYDIPAITTAGRYWVEGTAVVDGEPRLWSMFVKHVHEWSRSPFFEFVPEAMREMARRTVPWRTEGEVYRSDLIERLPAGLTMPRAVGVHEIDDLAYAVWLETVPIADDTWDAPRYQAAARLLGRFAASSAVRELGGIGRHDWSVEAYVDGRLANQVLPMLRSDEIWQHPLFAGPFAQLRTPLLDAADRVREIAQELMAFPELAAHGDACPNNLLIPPDREGFTLIDFGFFGIAPVGFDLGQLLVGDVQIGLRSSDDLAERDEACLVAYHEGLHEEELEIGLDDVRRAHALQLMLFTGLSCAPFDLLDQELTPGAQALAQTRADIARFSLDLLDRTDAASGLS